MDGWVGAPRSIFKHTQSHCLLVSRSFHAQTHNTHTQVEFEAQETFQLVGPGAGKVPEEEEGGQGAAVATRQHYFTFESDFLRGTEPEWQVGGLVFIRMVCVGLYVGAYLPYLYTPSTTGDQHQRCH